MRNQEKGLMAPCVAPEGYVENISFLHVQRTMSHKFLCVIQSPTAGRQHFLDQALPFTLAKTLQRSLHLERLYLPWATLKPVGHQIPDGPSSPPPYLTLATVL